MSRRRIAEEPEVVRSPRPGQVLVVEDEQDVAELLRHNLNRAGYDVLSAPNGADAVKMAA
jgi:CheY-like chemotaxis protein